MCCSYKRYHLICCKIYNVCIKSKNNKLWQKHIPRLTWGHWGFLTKVNLYCKKWLNVPCFDMEWIYTWHASGFYGKWSLYKIWITFSYSCVRYHKNTQQLWQNRHKYPILAQSQSIFYVHQTSMIVDHCTQHDQNPLIHLWHIVIIIILKEL